MADNKEQDEFAEINKKVKDQAVEIYNLIFGKYLTAMEISTNGTSNEALRVFYLSDTGIGISPNESGKLSYFEDQCRLMAQAIDLFTYYWKKGIKQSTTWQKMNLFDQPITEQKNFIKIDLAGFKNAKWENDDQKQQIMQAAEAVNSVVELLSNTYNQKKITEKQYTLDKLYKALLDIKKQVLSSADKIKSASNGLLKEQATILNLKDVIGDFEKMSYVYTDNYKGSEEGTGEEMPKDVKNAVDTVAKEVVTANDKPEDPNVAEKFKKIETDMQKTKDIVMKWADPKKNKSMYHRLMNVIHTIGQDVASQLIPQAWIFAAMNRVKDVIGEAIAQKTFLNLLNEVEEQGSDQAQSSGESAASAAGGKDENKKKENIEKVKKLVDAVDEILQKQKPTEFKDAYRNWLKEVQEVMKAAGENEKIKEKLEKALGGDSDPYKQICLLYLALTSKDEGEEEGEGDGSKEEPAKEEPAKPTAGAENSSFAWNFQNYIKESLNK